MPGFGSAAELVAWRVPEGAPYRLVRLVERNLCVEPKEPNNGRALRDAAFIVSPRSASLERTYANLQKADQLAPLTQGPPVDGSVPPLGQTAGVGP